VWSKEAGENELWRIDMLLFFNVSKIICCGDVRVKGAIYHVFMQQNGVSGTHDEKYLGKKIHPNKNLFP